MMSAFCSRSERNESVQHSTATMSTFVPGRAAAMSRATERPGHAAGAAQAEQRHAVQVGAEAERCQHSRFQRRRRHARRGDGDDGVDLPRRQARRIERLAGRILEKARGAGEIGVVALAPVARLQEPFERLDRPAPVYAGILEGRHHALEMFVARTQELTRIGEHQILGKFMRGQGSRHRVQKHVHECPRRTSVETDTSGEPNGSPPVLPRCRGVAAGRVPGQGRQ